MTRGQRIDRRIPPAAWTACLVVLLTCPATSLGQSTWEVTPYKTTVWWAVGDEPDLPEQWRSTFSAQLERKLRVIFQAMSETTVAPVPDSMKVNFLRDPSSLTAEEIYASSSNVSGFDKLFFVTVSSEHGSYRIRVREFDCLLAHLGPTDEARVGVLAQVASRATQMISNAFSPVLRIDRYSQGEAKSRLRAGSLIRGPEAVGKLQQGDLLLPFDRRVRAAGRPQTNDVRPIDWTYLRITDLEEGSTGYTAQVITGLKQPFRSKRNRTRQQIAIRARPTYDASVIHLQTRGPNPEPLVGYEIHEKGSDGVTMFLGYTDWRGELTVPLSQSAIRTLLVRSGDRVIARLPVVPGLRQEILARVVDNRQRVRADGFLSGIQTSLVDLVARRESLTTRIRRLTAAGELARAESLMEEFRSLPTQSDFQRDVQEQQRELNVTDARLRRRIDTTFVKTYQLLDKHLDAGRLRKLEEELEAAKATANEVR